MSATTRQSATTSRFNPQHINYFSASVLAAVCIGSLLRWAVLDWGDGLRCDGYLNGGEWLDDGVWKNWQPDGCMHVPLDSASISKCFPSSHTLSPTTSSSSSSSHTHTNSRQILFIGDSITRQLFFASANLADPTLPISHEQAGGEKHSDRELVATVGGKGEGEGLTFTFWWDPFLNETRTTEYLSHSSSDPNGLLVLGSGLWYLRHPSSGGIASWEHMIGSTFNSISSAQPILSKSELTRPPPMLKGPTGLSQAIIFLPVVMPVDGALSEDRAQTINHVDVEAMNSDLSARISLSSSTSSSSTQSTAQIPPIKIPFVFNQLLIPTETEDGIHFSQKMLRKQAEILFGWRCNEVASRFTGACCKRYKRIRPAQGLVLLLVVGWAPLGLFLRRKSVGTRFHTYFPQESAILPISIFGSAILYLYLSDRTHIFLKEQKDWEPYTYAGLMVVALVVGLATMKRGDTDMGFLNREQTDEWKGWMQIEILIYHILGGSKISGIYNVTRVFVASYLFMTGYGHFTYYLKKKDFGFQRVAMVLFRLNLLSVVLPYTMNTDYAFYYFAPLVSWWYLIIYFMMWAGNKYNDNPAFLLAKLLAVAALTTTVTHQGWIMQRIFEALHIVFRISWSGSEWNFRVGLDMFIPYAGMLCAYAYIKAVEYRIADKPWWRMVKNTTVALSGLAMAWFFWFELTRPDKFTYNASHPYISFIPICAFVIIRNATSILRSCNSRLFMFIGQCSLETFIFQYHGWMASDTNGVLLVIPGTRWRPLNLVLSTIVFIWLSHKVSIATGDITNWAVGKAKAVKRAAAAATLPLPVTAAPKPTPTIAEVVAEAVDTEGKIDGVVPESIPLMGREEPAKGKEVDNEGLLAQEAAAESAAVDAEIEALLAGPIEPEESRIAGWARKLGELSNEHVGVRLSLVLVALWTLNLLY